MRRLALAMVTAVGMLVGLAACSEKPAATAKSSQGDAATTSAQASQPAAPVNLTVQGSDTMLSLSSDWAEQFMKVNQSIRVSVTGGGSGTGIAALRNGTCDVANSSRSIRESEIASARQSGIDVKEFIVAKDGITVIVHPSNPLTRLSRVQLKGLFDGSIRNWKEIGGPDAPVLAYSRDSSSGTHVVFKNIAIGGGEYRADARFVPSNSAIVEAVSTNVGAVGYIGYGHYGDAKTRVKALQIEGPRGYVMPSPETILDGSYVISRDLFFYTAGDPTGATKRYIDFALSREGQRIVSSKGFIAVK